MTYSPPFNSTMLSLQHSTITTTTLSPSSFSSFSLRFSNTTPQPAARPRFESRGGSGCGIRSTFGHLRKVESRQWQSSSGNTGRAVTVFANSVEVSAQTSEFKQMAVEKGPVVSVDWLHEHLYDPDLKVLDGSWYMPSEKRHPLQEYQESHIPGALYFDVDGISDVTSKMPHMLPSEAAFSAAASALGLQNHHSIVIYDGKGIFSSARVWWMFRAFGHEKVWVLDGGLPKWLGQKFDVDSHTSSGALSKIEAASKAVKASYQGEQVDTNLFRAHLQEDFVWSIDEVKSNIESATHVQVDARSKGRFDGSAPEPRAGLRSGHVPGSTCVPFNEVLSSTGTLLSPEELIPKFEHAGVPLDGPIIVSCGTGVTACILALALHRLGKADVPVYDGSWTEWSSTPNSPIETNL